LNLSFLIFLSVLQGVTELFPVSSLGHTLLVPALFGMHVDKHAPQLLPFLVALHLGTAFALLWYFRERWCALVRGFFASFGGRRNDDAHMMWALIIGTIPAGLVGLLLAAARRLAIGQHEAQAGAVHVGVGVERQVAREAVHGQLAHRALCVAPITDLAVHAMTSEKRKQQRITAADARRLAPVGVFRPMNHLLAVDEPRKQTAAGLRRETEHGGVLGDFENVLLRRKRHGRWRDQ